MGAENHYLSISELTPYHKKKIAELRQRAAADLDLYPEYNTDFQLLRWLMGWDYNIGESSLHSFYYQRVFRCDPTQAADRSPGLV